LERTGGDGRDPERGTIGDRSRALLAGQNRALELIARNAPLAEVLTYLTRMIEAEEPGLLCSVLLLDGDRLRHGAAPSLPESYCRAIDGVQIGPKVGSCGTAAFTGERVIVTDIASDARWAGYADLALDHGLRACWSTPIRAATGEVIGTFAIYYREPREPCPEHLQLVEVATHIAGIAIERRRADEALADRARRLAEADRRKDEFLAMLAHELRNPLAPIVSALELLRLRADDPAAVGRYRAVIERQVWQLSRLVDDLLDVSRITRGKMVLKKERASVAALCTRAVEASRPALDAAKHTFSITMPEEPIEIVVDPVRIAQVLSNLLNNAAKYTEPGGHVALSVAREDGEVVFRVRDDGIGIAPEMLPKVFDLFVQADGATARSHGGLGIGLTLVRTLVELHGGRVEAHSEGLGRGTEMLVRLPADASAPEDARAKAAPGARTRERFGHVLLVDDNVDAVTMLADALRERADAVSVTHDGPAALARAAEQRPDAAIVDVGLPGMDGYEVARRLRAAYPDDGLRLVALTGYGQQADLQRAQQAGFDAHLVKPADLERVLAALMG
jgi:signal transduction histidine kinase